MNQTTGSEFHKTQSKLKLSPIAQPIRPQRFIADQLRTESIKKQKSYLPEIENAMKIDELLSTCQPDKMKKILAQKKEPMAQSKKPDEKIATVNKLKKVNNLAKMNEIFSQKTDPIDPILYPPQSNQSKLDDITNHDEGCAKIKELTKQNQHYQIYDQIKKKHESNAKIQKQQNRMSIRQFSRPKLIEEESKTNQNELEIKNSFSVPVDFKIAKKTMTKQSSEQQICFSKDFRMNDFPDLLFPFKNDFKEKEITLELSKKALPGILEFVNRNDLNLRQNKTQTDKKGSHEFHIFFNLALTYESEKDHEKAIFNYLKYLEFAKEIKDRFAISFTTNKMGINLLKMKKANEAEELFQRNLEFLQKDKMFISYYNIGLCSKLKKNCKDAIKNFQICKQWAEQNKVTLSGSRSNFIVNCTNWNLSSSYGRNKFSGRVFRSELKSKAK